MLEIEHHFMPGSVIHKADFLTAKPAKNFFNFFSCPHVTGGIGIWCRHVCLSLLGSPSLCGDLGWLNSGIGIHESCSSLFRLTDLERNRHLRFITDLIAVARPTMPPITGKQFKVRPFRVSLDTFVELFGLA